MEAADRARPLAVSSGTIATSIATVVIRMGAGGSSRRARSPPPVQTLLDLQLVGELDDQDAVLGDQSDQRDQADLV